MQRALLVTQAAQPPVAFVAPCTEEPALGRCAHRAARFAHVPAVLEAAGACETLHFGEAEGALIEHRGGGGEVAHAGGVDERRTVLEIEAACGARRVPPVACARECADLDLGPRYEVAHERGLADTGLPDERSHRTGREPRAQRGKPLARLRGAVDDLVGSGCIRFKRCAQRRIDPEVDLVQDERGAHSRGAGRREIAVDDEELGGGEWSQHDEELGQVGNDGFARAAGTRAVERRASRQNLDDVYLIVVRVDAATDFISADHRECAPEGARAHFPPAAITHDQLATEGRDHACLESLCHARRLGPPVCYTAAQHATTTDAAMPSADYLVWIDLEMTGLKPDADVIIEIATVVTDGQLSVIGDGPVLAIHHSDEVLARMDDWNQRQHSSSGLLARVRASHVSPAEAEQRTLEFLAPLVTPGSSPMCGNSICQDRRFLARYMPELERFFHYRNLDVSTLKELARRWAPAVADSFVKQGTHLAHADIHESIRELKHYRARLLAPAYAGSP